MPTTWELAPEPLCLKWLLNLRRHLGRRGAFSLFNFTIFRHIPHGVSLLLILFIFFEYPSNCDQEGLVTPQQYMLLLKKLQKNLVGGLFSYIHVLLIPAVLNDMLIDIRTCSGRAYIISRQYYSDSVNLVSKFSHEDSNVVLMC